MMGPFYSFIPILFIQYSDDDHSIWCPFILHSFWYISFIDLIHPDLTYSFVGRYHSYLFYHLFSFDYHFLISFFIPFPGRLQIPVQFLGVTFGGSLGRNSFILIHRLPFHSYLFCSMPSFILPLGDLDTFGEAIRPVPTWQQHYILDVLQIFYHSTTVLGDFIHFCGRLPFLHFYSISDLHWPFYHSTDFYRREAVRRLQAYHHCCSPLPFYHRGPFHSWGWDSFHVGSCCWSMPFYFCSSYRSVLGTVGGSFCRSVLPAVTTTWVEYHTFTWNFYHLPPFISAFISGLGPFYLFLFLPGMEMRWSALPTIHSQEWEEEMHCSDTTVGWPVPADVFDYRLHTPPFCSYREVHSLFILERRPGSYHLFGGLTAMQWVYLPGFLCIPHCYHLPFHHACLHLFLPFDTIRCIPFWRPSSFHRLFTGGLSTISGILLHSFWATIPPPGTPPLGDDLPFCSYRAVPVEFHSGLIFWLFLIHTTTCSLDAFPAFLLFDYRCISILILHFYVLRYPQVPATVVHILGTTLWNTFIPTIRHSMNFDKKILFHHSFSFDHFLFILPFIRCILMIDFIRYILISDYHSVDSTFWLPFLWPTFVHSCSTLFYFYHWPVGYHSTFWRTFDPIPTVRHSFDWLDHSMELLTIPTSMTFCSFGDHCSHWPVRHLQWEGGNTFWLILNLLFILVIHFVDPFIRFLPFLHSFRWWCSIPAFLVISPFHHFCSLTWGRYLFILVCSFGMVPPFYVSFHSKLILEFPFGHSAFVQWVGPIHSTISFPPFIIHCLHSWYILTGKIQAWPLEVMGGWEVGGPDRALRSCSGSRRLICSFRWGGILMPFLGGGYSSIHSWFHSFTISFRWWEGWRVPFYRSAPACGPFLPLIHSSILMMHSILIRLLECSTIFDTILHSFILDFTFWVMGISSFYHFTVDVLFLPPMRARCIPTTTDLQFWEGLMGRPDHRYTGVEVIPPPFDAISVRATILFLGTFLIPIGPVLRCVLFGDLHSVWYLHSLFWWEMLPATFWRWFPTTCSTRYSAVRPDVRWEGWGSTISACRYLDLHSEDGHSVLPMRAFHHSSIPSGWAVSIPIDTISFVDDLPLPFCSFCDAISFWSFDWCRLIRFIHSVHSTIPFILEYDDTFKFHSLLIDDVRFHLSFIHSVHSFWWLPDTDIRYVGGFYHFIHSFDTDHSRWWPFSSWKGHFVGGYIHSFWWATYHSTILFILGISFISITICSTIPEVEGNFITISFRCSCSFLELPPFLPRPIRFCSTFWCLLPPFLITVTIPTCLMPFLLER